MLADSITYYRSETISRTKKGIDINGNPFVPYNSTYKKYKSQNGRSTGKVNLESSGKLLNSIGISVGNNSASCQTRSHSKIGFYHNNGSGNNPKREWFGFNKVILRGISILMRKQFKLKGKI